VAHFLQDAFAGSVHILTQEKWFQVWWEKMDSAANQKTSRKIKSKLKITMKKSNIQKRKLTKSELKEIKGSGRLCFDGFCRMGEFEEWQLGAGDKNGFCC